tara:strand:- start:153 stop:422 length:270 start_codon:yes stop_codon:yes gene_type:complete
MQSQSVCDPTLINHVACQVVNRRLHSSIDGDSHQWIFPLPIRLACLIERLFVKDHAQQIKPQQFRLIAERKFFFAPSSLDGSQDSFQCL